MAQDSEKRFHTIMGKLFHAPNPNSTPNSPSSCSGEKLTRGTKRRNLESALALVEPKTSNAVEKYQHSSASAGLSQPPLCRPWDRGDLMRRLATFKSMTWFAKPKVVSAVNCARRGWVNVDTDIIACESCGARLLFSTPSSWTHQQVEKAALVFSLKLDSGHKLLCPWIDNACDETLAHFPPTPPPVLVDKFRERSSALLKLLVLPVISSSAVEYMRSPQLEEFLKQSSMLEYGNESASISERDSLGNEENSANLYHQAQKLISLCGWEPRSLSYLVNCEDRENQFVIDVNGQNPSISVHSTGSNEVVEATENAGAHKSFVLDCRLCGASVGLWTFSMVSRPVEFFRLVGYADVNGENNFGNPVSGTENHADNREAVVSTASDGRPLHKERSSYLKRTIAGGPPPTKQNFRATIYIPVIGRTLRSKFSYDSDYRDSAYDNQEEVQPGSKNKILLQEGKECTEHNVNGQVVHTENGLLQSKQHDQGPCICISDDQSHCLNHHIRKKGDTFRKENNNHMPAEGTNTTEQETPSKTGTHCPLIQSSTETAQNVEPGPSQSDELPENLANAELISPAVGKFSSSEVSHSSIATSDVGFTTGNGESSQNERSLVITSDNAFVARSTGNDPKRVPEDNTMKFDPIKQHRHFCPWIVSTGGRSPGWQQTLSALHRQRDHLHLSPEKSPPSASMIKVDDPVASVRKLFTSQVTKRMKSTNG